MMKWRIRPPNAECHRNSVILEHKERQVHYEKAK